ncbi:lipase family protein [Flexivirga caeni]|uniref:Triacylglycerol lipase n=1 Tax=Flexivirga caeni TaxID=2294115 RepID=A0A3M9M2H7_9MICO|nr:lipase family protein [Flexivirga caeni]RNI19672.1 triacylglycerol lipase [Flexivirga caeni]
MARSRTFAAIVTGAVAAGALGGLTAAPAHADTNFFSYHGSRPLASYAPGAVLGTRTIDYHLAGIALPVKVEQILYRTQNAVGAPDANVTSVILPPGRAKSGEAVSYQSFYDSLSVADSPSRVFAGDQRFPGGVIPNIETALIAPMLLQGYPIVVPDTEGPTADFAAGPEYGATTLDSIRAASSAAGTGINASTKLALFGYSGGAIGTNWAAAMAPSYAPDVNKRLVGASEGGLLVDPAHNLKYVSGSPVWAGVAPMALAGASRAYGLNLAPYVSTSGASVLAGVQNDSIAQGLLANPFITWQQLVKPQYANPDSIKPFVDAVNKLNLGQRPSPTVPMFIEQGAGGFFEGTPGNKPGIGAGDGVMITGDVRSLARQYCASGTTVKYTQQDLLSHVATAVPWATASIGWINDRFAGQAAPSSCGSIPAGNSLAPEVYAGS